MPEISVVMSVYNLARGQILKQSIRSILEQDFKDFELLICDDGSTDGTFALLKKIARSDSRIRLLRNKTNRKAGYARNRCIKAAKGKFIAVMDADDISAQNRLRMQHSYLMQHPDIDFVGCRGEFFDRRIGDDGELYWYCKKPQPEDFLFSLPFVHASILFRREALQKVHGYDTSRWVTRTEDYDILLRLYGQGCCGANLPEILYYIRRDADQYKRRKYRYRINEAHIKWRAFYQLGLFPKGIFFALKPLAVGLIPVRLLSAAQKKYYAKKGGLK